MKIVFSDNRLGGLLGFRVDVIRHFIAQGHEVILLAPKARSQWDKVGTMVPGCRVVEVPMSPHGMNPVKDFRLFAKYLRIYRKERPDLVFNYTIKPNIYSCLAARLCGVKVIDMLAGLGYIFSEGGLTKRLGRALYRFSLRRAHRVMVLNRDNRDLVLRERYALRERTVMLPCGEGINLEAYPYREEPFDAPVRFLMIARVLYDKGYREFVEAAKTIHKSRPEVVFELLGPLDTDSPTRVLPEVVEQDVKSGHIRYLGFSNNVPDYVLRDGVVVVLPSYGEGLNRSLMEACSMGRPIIASDIAGCKEMVDDGRSGYLVAPYDSQSLASAFDRFLKLSREERQQMSRRSHQLAIERFDVRLAIDIYEELVEQVMAEG